MGMEGTEALAPSLASLDWAGGEADADGGDIMFTLLFGSVVTPFVPVPAPVTAAVLVFTLVIDSSVSPDSASAISSLTLL